MDNSIEIFKSQQDAVKEVVQAFDKINISVDNFVDKQVGFHKQVEGLNDEKIHLMDSVTNIMGVIEESSAVSEEVASITMTEASSINVISQVSETMRKSVDVMTDLLSKAKVNPLRDKRKRVAYIFDVDDPFWEPTIREAKKTAEAFNYVVDFFSPHSRETSGSDISGAINEYIESGVDALIISPVNDARVVNAINEAYDKGIKIVYISSKLDNTNYHAVVETNGNQMGITAADNVIDYCEHSGEVVLGRWSDVALESIKARENGFREGMSREREMKLIVEDIMSEPTDAEIRRYVKVVQEKHPNTKMVFATNINWGLALGKYAAANPLPFEIATIDLTRDIAELIKRGSIKLAIAQRSFVWGNLPLEIIHDLFEGKKVNKYTDTGSFGVTPQNISIHEKNL